MKKQENFKIKKIKAKLKFSKNPIKLLKIFKKMNKIIYNIMRYNKNYQIQNKKKKQPLLSKIDINKLKIKRKLSRQIRMRIIRKKTK